MISRPSSARMSAAYVEASSADAISNIDGLGRGVKGVANQEALQRILERPDEKAIEKIGDGAQRWGESAQRPSKQKCTRKNATHKPRLSTGVLSMGWVMKWLLHAGLPA